MGANILQERGPRIAQLGERQTKDLKVPVRSSQALQEDLTEVMQDAWDDLHDLQHDFMRLVWHTLESPGWRDRMSNMDAEPVANHRRPTISVLDALDRAP